MNRKTGLPLHMNEKPIGHKSNTTYKVTWGNGNENTYDDISEVVAFLELNHVESFTVIQGKDNDITGVIQGILVWR